MCTVSIFARAGGTLLTMNRDEQRSRTEGPTPHQTEDYFYPVDALSGGTWCAVHTKGYALALLNHYEMEEQYTGADSRGNIIPELLSLPSQTSITEYFTLPNLYRFSPFDLLVVGGRDIRHYRWTGEICTQAKHSIDRGPFVYTSSSERTCEVTSYRKELFSDFQESVSSPNREQVLSKFHQHRDQKKPRDGVFVDRPHIHTKSICQILLSEEETEITYWPESALYEDASTVSWLRRKGSTPSAVAQA